MALLQERQIPPMNLVPDWIPLQTLYIIQKKFVAKHTIMNKVTGAVLFILPLTLSIVDLKYSGGFICTIAILAAVQEGHLIRSEKQML